MYRRRTLYLNDSREECLSLELICCQSAPLLIAQSTSLGTPGRNLKAENCRSKVPSLGSDTESSLGVVVSLSLLIYEETVFALFADIYWYFSPLVLGRSV